MSNNSTNLTNDEQTKYDKEMSTEEEREEGREEERRRVALRMLDKGFPKETVAEITGIDLSSIESLQ